MWGSPALRATYQRVQGYDADRVVHQAHGQEAGALLAGRNVGQAHAYYVGRHLLALCVFIELARLQSQDRRREEDW